jgi:hypothetical protein
MADIWDKYSLPISPETQGIQGPSQSPDLSYGSSTGLDFDSQFASLFNPNQTGTGEVPKYAPSRGFFADIGSSLLRSVVGTAKLTGHALDQANIRTGLEEWAEEANKKYSWLLPDREEAFDLDSGVYKSFKQAVESVSNTAVPLGAGLVAGTYGGAAVGIGAGLAALVGLFGMGTYNETYRESKDIIGEETARKHALNTAFFEVSTEGLSDAIAVASGGLLSAPAKGLAATAKVSLKSILKMGPKDFAIAVGSNVAGEVGGESLNAYLQTSSAIKHGLDPGVTPSQAAIAAVGPALWLSGGIAIGTQKISRSRKKAVVGALTEPGVPQEVRSRAADIVFNQLQKEDVDIANNFKEVSDYIIAKDGKFNINKDFVEQVQSLLRKKKSEESAAEQAQDIRSSATGIVTNALTMPINDPVDIEDHSTEPDPMTYFQEELGKMYLNNQALSGMSKAKDASIKLAEKAEKEGRLADAVSLKSFGNRVDTLEGKGETRPDYGIEEVATLSNTPIMPNVMDLTAKEILELTKPKSRTEIAVEGLEGFEPGSSVMDTPLPEDFFGSPVTPGQPDKLILPKTTVLDITESKGMEGFEPGSSLLDLPFPEPTSSPTAQTKAEAAPVASEEKIASQKHLEPQKKTPEITDQNRKKLKSVLAVLRQKEEELAEKKDLTIQDLQDVAQLEDEVDSYLNTTTQSPGEVHPALENWGKGKGLKLSQDPERFQARDTSSEEGVAGDVVIGEEDSTTYMAELLSEASEKFGKNISGRQFDRITAVLSDKKEYAPPQEMRNAFNTAAKDIDSKEDLSDREKQAEKALTLAIVNGDVNAVNDILSQYREGHHKAAAVEAAVRIKGALDRSPDSEQKEIVRKRALGIISHFIQGAPQARSLQGGIVDWKKAAANMYYGKHKDTGQDYLLLREAVVPGERGGGWRISIAAKGLDELTKLEEVTVDQSHGDESLGTFVRRFNSSGGHNLFTKKKLDDAPKGSYAAPKAAFASSFEVSKSGEWYIVPRSESRWGLIRKDDFENWQSLSKPEQNKAWYKKDGRGTFEKNDIVKIAAGLERAEQKTNQQYREVPEDLTAKSPTLEKFRKDTRDLYDDDVKNKEDAEESPVEEADESARKITKDRSRDLDKAQTRTNRQRIQDLEAFHNSTSKAFMSGNFGRLDLLKNRVLFKIYGYKNPSRAPKDLVFDVDKFVVASAGSSYQKIASQKQPIDTEIKRIEDMQNRVKYTYQRSLKPEERNQIRKLPSLRKQSEKYQSNLDNLARKSLRLLNTDNLDVAHGMLGTINFKGLKILDLKTDITAQPTAKAQRAEQKAGKAVVNDLKGILPPSPAQKEKRPIPGKVPYSIAREAKKEVVNIIGPLYRFEGQSFYRTDDGHVINKVGNRWFVTDRAGVVLEPGFPSLVAINKSGILNKPQVREPSKVVEEFSKTDKYEKAVSDYWDWQSSQEIRKKKPQELSKEKPREFNNGWREVTPKSNIVLSANGKLIAGYVPPPKKDMRFVSGYWGVWETTLAGTKKEGDPLVRFHSAVELMEELDGSKADPKKLKRKSKIKKSSSEEDIVDTGNTVSEVEDALVRGLGQEVVDRWAKIGVLEIVPDIESASGFGEVITSEDGTTVGFYNPDNGYITLIANRILKGQELNIFFHEGLHHIMDNDPFYQKNKAQVLESFSLLRSESDSIRKAYDIAKKFNPDLEGYLLDEEAYAHFIQDSTNRDLPWYRNTIAAVKRFLMKMKVPSNKLGLTEQDFAAMAIARIKKARVSQMSQTRTAGPIKKSSWYKPKGLVKGIKTYEDLLLHTATREDARRKGTKRIINEETTPKNSEGKFRSEQIYEDGKKGAWEHWIWNSKEDQYDKNLISEEEYNLLRRQFRIERRENDVQYMQEEEDLRGAVIEKATNTIKSAGEAGKYLLKSISNSVEEISKDAFSRLRHFEWDLHRRQKDYSNRIMSFYKAYRDIPPEEAFILDQALRNGDTETRDEILEENGFMEEFLEWEKVREEIEADAIKFGLISKLVKNHFPRSVKMGQVDNYMKALEKEDADEFTAIGNEIRKAEEAATRSNKTLTKEDKRLLVTKLLNSGHFNYMPKPGFVKDRSITYVKPEHAQYYMNSADTMRSYIFDMVNAIETRRFLGNSGRRRVSMMKDLEKISKYIEELTELKDRPETSPEDKARAEADLIEKARKYDNIQSKLIDLNSDLEESVSEFVLTEVTVNNNDRAKELVDLIRARLTQRGTSGVWGTMRDIAYAFTLGTPLSAITQLGDLALSAYSNGVGRTFVAMIESVPSLLSKENAITQEYFDFSHSMTDFSNNASAAVLDKLLVASGLKKMDLFGKEVFMRASLRKAKSMSKDAFVKEWAPMFMGDAKRAEAAHKDIKAGTMSGDALFILFNGLSQWQPISLSELPPGYNQAGNLRIAYMLKSFHIKALNNMVRELSQEWSNSKINAVKKFAYLVTLISLAGAGTDEIKDWIQGKEVPFSDNFYDNLTQIFLMNRFTLEKGIHQGRFISGLVEAQLPPFRYLDHFFDDVGKAAFDRENYKAKLWQDIPLIGRITYSHSKYGRETYLANLKKDIYSDIRDNAKKGLTLYTKDLRGKIEEYNSTASELKEEKLKYKQLSNIRKKALKDLRDSK